MQATVMRAAAMQAGNSCCARHRHPCLYSCLTTGRQGVPWELRLPSCPAHAPHPPPSPFTAPPPPCPPHTSPCPSSPSSPSHVPLPLLPSVSSLPPVPLRCDPVQGDPVPVHCCRQALCAVSAGAGCVPGHQGGRGEGGAFGQCLLDEGRGGGLGWGRCNLGSSKRIKGPSNGGR